MNTTVKTNATQSDFKQTRLNVNKRYNLIITIKYSEIKQT